MIRRLLLLLALCAPPALTAQPADLAGLDAYIEQAMRDWEVPGLALAVVRGDSVLYAQGYGVRQVGRPERVDAHTVFAIGSNTKAFTATALGLLVADGRLTWDDRVVDRLPGFQLYDAYATHEITLRDLLCHRAGFETWAGDVVAWGSTYSRADLIRRLRYLEPQFSFRSRFGYSNYLFLVAGETLAAVADTSWDDHVQARLLRPLGMTRTATRYADLQAQSNVAQPHTRADGRIVPIPYRNLDNDAPMGSMTSTVLDLARWLRLQINGGTLDGQRLVPASLLQATHTAQTPLPVSPRYTAIFTSRFRAYGLGWFLQDYRGHLLVKHGGAVDGMLSQVAFLPEEGLGVVVLTNSDDNTLYDALTFEVFDRLLGPSPRRWADVGMDAPDWSTFFLNRDRQAKAAQAAADSARIADRVATSRPSVSLDRYAGRYAHPHYGEAVVEARPEGLFIRLLAHPGILEAPLTHWQYDTFRAVWPDPVYGTSYLPFTLDADGQVTAFDVQIRPDFLDPLVYRFKRVSLR